MKDSYAELRELCVSMRRKAARMSVTNTLIRLMDADGIMMHCPQHHFIVPAAILTQAAIERETDEPSFLHWLQQAESRARKVPGGVCGDWGTCGAAIGVGIAVSILTEASPKARESWGAANSATGRALLEIAHYGGPRCCKRVSFLATMATVDFINEACNLHLFVQKGLSCKYHSFNTECLENGCPFWEKKLDSEANPI